MLTLTWAWPLPEPTRQLYRAHSVGELAVLNPWRAVDRTTLEFDPDRFAANVDVRPSSKDDDDPDVAGVPGWWDGYICIDYEATKNYPIMNAIRDPEHATSIEIGKAMTTCRDTIVALRERNPDATLLFYHLRTSNAERDPLGAGLERELMDMLDGLVLPMYLPGKPEKDAGRTAYQDRVLKWTLEEKVKRPELLVMPIVWKRRMSGAMATPQEWASVLGRAREPKYAFEMADGMYRAMTIDGLIIFEKSTGWSESEDAEFLRQIVNG